MTIRLAIVGLGKIAHDQHVPAIAASERFSMAAAATHAGTLDDIPIFPSVDALLASRIPIDAVAMCQPPQARFDAAAAAIRAGKHVLLEKPPGATLAEVDALTRLADAAGTTLFAAWHSRFAPAVAPARAWLAERRISGVEINWREDVRRWHPGQQWIWQPGGLGVFDPGINALSIATRILPSACFVRESILEVPANRAAPIAATLAMTAADGTPVRAVFDFRQTGPQSWDIVVNTDAGRLTLSQGGAALDIDGTPQPLPATHEYPALYAHFAELIDAGRSEVDLAPFRLVADAFLLGRQKSVAPFED